MTQLSAQLINTSLNGAEILDVKRWWIYLDPSLPSWLSCPCYASVSLYEIRGCACTTPRTQMTCPIECTLAGVLKEGVI